MSQETIVELAGEVDVYWVGYVGARVGKSEMEMPGKIFLVEGAVVGRVVGALEVYK